MGARAAPSDVTSEPRLNAAGRMLSVLEVFRSCSKPLRLSEISRRSGLSMTTAHRLTHELLDWNALERTDDGRYRLGTKMLELAAVSTLAMSLRERALPSLVRLHQTLPNLTVHLAIRDGVESVFVEALHSVTGATRMNRMGGRMPLPATATGRVLLAHAPDDIRDAVLTHPIKAYTSHTLVAPDALREELVEVRRVGTSITCSQVIEGTGGVAAPVVDGEREVVASVGILVRLSKYRLEEYRPIVTSVARRISRDLSSPGLIAR